MIPAGEALYLDCDTGIDDALALVFLLGAGRPPDLVGTVSGNVSASVAADNTRRILSLFGRPNIPVATGSDYPIHAVYPRGAQHVHGANGIGGIQLPDAPPHRSTGSAVAELIALARRRGGDLHIIAIGPLTNIAEALRRFPALPSVVASITIMGGAFHVPGNVTEYAEANIYGDPDAAAATFAAPWRDLLLVPLDITSVHLLGSHDNQRFLDSSSAAIQSLGGMLSHYFAFYRPVHAGQWSPLHDPLAAALAVGAIELTHAPTVTIEVDTSCGPERGRTIIGESDRDSAHRMALHTRNQSAPCIVSTVCSLEDGG